MKRSRSVALLLGVAATAAASPALLGGTSASAATADGRTSTPIKHVVVILKENRSFDNYFGTMPGVDGATTAKRSDGKTVALARTPDPLPHDVGHSPAMFLRAYHGGKMDRFDLESGAYANGPGTAPLALSQFQQSDIPAYWRYAKSYGLADKFFASWRGASLANNLYTVAGQAGRYDQGTSCVPNRASPGTQACHTDGRTVYHLPHGPKNPRSNSPHWGCDAGPKVTVPMMSAMTGVVDDTTYPCFRFKSLPDLLTENSLSWKMYSDADKPKHNALESIDSIRNTSSEWAKVQPLDQFRKDARAGTLPNVSWVVSRQDDHAPASVCLGENETVEDVNAVMSTPQWARTAVLVVWDEWGGFYDHVPPPQIDKVSFGFRVPFLAISPWVKPGGVDNRRNSHASILKFIEDNWRLGNLGADDARPDTGSNLMGMFDFRAAKRVPKIQLTPRPCTPLTPEQQALVDNGEDD